MTREGEDLQRLGGMIDPRIKYVGVSKLREMNADFLVQMQSEGLMYVLQQSNEPIAVILGYKAFMDMQRRLEEAARDLDELLNLQGER